MDEVNLTELRQKVDATASPFKVVRRDAIEFVGQLEKGTDAPKKDFVKNVYLVEGTEVLVSDLVSKQLDELIGLTPQQANIIKTASGEDGVRDFRNYLATANSMTNPVSVALIANPRTKTVCGMVPIKEEPITSDSFFDFLNLFMEFNHLYPTRYEMAYDPAAGMTIYLNSREPDIRQIAPNEDFMTNAYYMRWNLGQIELGRYYERLICSNGQTATITLNGARAQSIREEKVAAMLGIPRDRELLKIAFNKFGDKAREAMRVKASMAELMFISNRLDKYLVYPDEARQIAPFGEQLNMYMDAGYQCQPEQLKSLLASMTVWELYNSVTDFASNNQEWDMTDNRRGILQGEALHFLMKNRDIKIYDDIFK